VKSTIMAGRRAKQVVAALADEQAYKNAIAESDKFLVVIDIHQNWCGPCTVMESVYRKVYIELDKAEERVKFYTVSTAVCRATTLVA
jgi:thioredoxin 1